MPPQESYPYLLPRIDFVGGETQELYFNCWYLTNRNVPFDLTGKTAQFAIIDYMNPNGTALLIKKMSSTYDSQGQYFNVLTVTLKSTETVDYHGKYIYQITIKDSDGGIVDIPKQGTLFVFNNINPSFI